MDVMNLALRREFDKPMLPHLPLAPIVLIEASIVIAKERRWQAKHPDETVSIRFGQVAMFYDEPVMWINEICL
jgi:hypothetical protein